MRRKQFHIQAHYYLAIIIALCLPFARFTPIFISLLLLNWLVEGDFKNKFQTLLQNKFSFLFLAFFVLHLGGIAYTSNMDSGLFDLQVKLSLFIFPIVLASRPFNNFQVRNIFLFFVAGGILSSLFLLSRAAYLWFSLSENHFFYQAFSVLLHPSYLSMYLDLSIAWLLLGILRSEKGRRITSVISGLIILYFTFIIILLSSKMGLLTLILIFVGFTVYFIISRRKLLVGAIVLALISTSVFSLVRFVPEIGDRVQNAVHALSNPPKDNSEIESTAVRLLIWQAAREVVSEHPVLGVGTGDSKDELMKEYKRQEMNGAYEHNLNAHNEFYQVAVSLGMIGLLVLVLSLFAPLFAAFRRQNVIYAAFLLIIIFNFMPESMLEVQAGVMFYAFFNSLLCFCTNFVPDKK